MPLAFSTSLVWKSLSSSDFVLKCLRVIINKRRGSRDETQESEENLLDFKVTAVEQKNKLNNKDKIV